MKERAKDADGVSGGNGGRGSIKTQKTRNEMTRPHDDLRNMVYAGHDDTLERAFSFFSFV